jgi:hypothetical protein
MLSLPWAPLKAEWRIALKDTEGRGYQEVLCIFQTEDGPASDEVKTELGQGG